MKSIRAWVKDIKAWLFLLSIIGAVVLYVTVYAELPKKVKDLKTKVEETAKETKGNIDKLAESTGKVAVSLEKFLAVQTAQLQTQAVRDKAQDDQAKMMFNLWVELRKQNGKAKPIGDGG